MFIERTDAEAETPIVWPPDVKNWLIRKDPLAGKDWRQEEKGMTEDKTVGWHHQLDRHEFEQAGSWWWTGKPGMLQSMGSQRVGCGWATELNWSQTAWYPNDVAPPTLWNVSRHLLGLMGRQLLLVLSSSIPNSPLPLCFLFAWWNISLRHGSRYLSCIHKMPSLRARAHRLCLEEQKDGKNWGS